MNNNTIKKDEVLKRIKIAKGHLDKVRRMYEDGAYCPDIIHQSKAVQAALKKIDQMILHGHLHSCVLKDLHGDSNKNEKLIDEIVELFEKT